MTENTNTETEDHDAVMSPQGFIHALEDWTKHNRTDALRTLCGRPVVAGWTHQRDNWHAWKSSGVLRCRNCTGIAP